MAAIKQAIYMVGLAAFVATGNTSALAQDDGEALLCRVQALVMKMEEHVSEEMYYMCETKSGQGPYFLDLPSDFTDSHPELTIGNTFISIANATVVDEGDGLPSSIIYPVDTLISVVDPFSRRELEVANQASYKTLGVRRVMVVRVTSLDSEVSIDQATLSDRIFGIGDGAETVNMISQFRDCSAGDLQMVPADEPGVIDGVYEMFLPRNTSDSLETYYSGMHSTLLKELGSDLRSRVDDIMICLPANANRNGRGFIAFALGGANPLSYYRDASCGSLTAYMHEVGHHFGLQHSGRRGSSDYADVSGYMGYATGGVPAMCYNGGNHWFLRWFEDRRVEVTTVNSWSGKLAAFADYTDTTAGEHVVLMKVGDYYLQYNRAKKHNAGTRGDQDKVTIVIRLPNGQTDLVGSLQATDPPTEASFFYAEDFDGTGQTMVFEACAMVSGPPDYIFMNVYLTGGKQSALCSMQPSTSPSASPKPSVSPSTSRPSVSPTTTFVPSNNPTFGAPSASPSLAPTGKCEDDHDASFSVRYSLLSRNRQRTCIWLFRNKMWQERICNPEHVAYQVCPETCGACADGCSDDKEFTIYVNEKIGAIGCGFLAVRPVFATHLCSTRPAVANACGETCNTCSEEDEKVLHFSN